MNAQTLKREIETEAASALRQLDSDEFLRAAAGGEPTTQALLETAAASEHAAAMTFETWIQTESDTNAQAAFERVAEQEHTHYDRVTTVMDAIGVGGTDTDGNGNSNSNSNSNSGTGGDDTNAETHTQDAPGPMHAYLRGRETTIQRIASGMVGRPLASLQTHARLISYFESHSEIPDNTPHTETVPETQDNPAASLFRDLFDETEDVLDNGLELLTTQCTVESDWDAAIAVATYTIRLAADDTRDALAGMS
jgi:hypothetical protein